MKANLSVVFNYLKSDLIKKQRSFKIGLITIFLVIAFVSLLLNAILLSPVIFLKISENSVGEADFYIIPSSGKDVKNKKSIFEALIEGKSNTTDETRTIQNSIEDIVSSVLSLNFDLNNIESKLPTVDLSGLSSIFSDFNFQPINFNELNDKLINSNNSDSDISGLAPRWILYGNATKDNTWASTNIIVLNSRIENKYNIGRELILPNLGYLECYVTESVYQSLNLTSINNRFELKISLYDIYNKLGNINLAQKSNPTLTGSASNAEGSIDEYFNPKIDVDLFVRDKSSGANTSGWIIIDPPMQLGLNNTDAMLNPKTTSKSEAEFYRSLIKSLPFLEAISIKVNSSSIASKGFNSSIWSNLNDSIDYKGLNNTVYNFINENIFGNIKKGIDSSNSKENVTVSTNINNNQYNATLTTSGNVNSTYINEQNQKNLLSILSNIKELIKNNDNSTNLYQATSGNNNDITQVKINKTSIENFIYDNEQELNTTLNITDILLNLPDNEIINLFTIKVNLRIASVLPNGNIGKWPSALGNVVAIDSSFGREYLIDNLIGVLSNFISISLPIPNNISPNFDKIKSDIINSNQLRDFNLDNFALLVAVTLNNKIDIYNQQSKGQLKDLSTISNRILDKYGVDKPIETEMLIYDAYQAVGIVQSFLNNIFISIIFFLTILSIMLVYSLMLGNVEEKTFEFGMLRAIGYKKKNMTFLIILQAIVFSIPAIFIGLMVSGIANLGLSYFLSTFSGLPQGYSLKYITVISSIFLGISIPILSSYLPILSALGRNLKDSLAIFNKKISDLTISIIKLEKLGLSPSTTVISILMILMGFGTYYLAPLSFMYQNITLFLFLLNMLILIMILGLIFMFQLIVPCIQLIILNIMFLVLRFDKNVKFIIKKNLQGHFVRNQKTSIMFMIALGFIIYSGCSLGLIANFIVTASKDFFGSDIYITQSSQYETLEEINLRKFLDKFNEEYPDQIKSYTFVTYPMDEVIGSQIILSPFIQYPSTNKKLIGVEENYLTSVYDKIMSYSQIDENLKFRTSNENYGQKDIVSGLYLNNGFSKWSLEYTPILSERNNFIVHPSFEVFSDRRLNYNKDILLLVSEGLREANALDINQPMSIKINKNPQNIYAAKIIAFGIKLPGFSWSSYSVLSANAELITSIDQFKDIMEIEGLKDEFLLSRLQTQTANQQTKDSIRKQTLLIKFNDYFSVSVKDLLLMKLKVMVNNDNTSITDVVQLINEADNIANILEYFFIIIGVIALILSFFLIWISFHSNIKDNICEFGIIRSIGISQHQSIRIYLYEAFIIIICSIIIGTLIGIFVSVTLVLQFNLFLELPFQLVFPYNLYIILVSLAIVFALVGSFYPTYKVSKISLVKTLKGLVD